MGIVSIYTDTAGQVGVNPRRVKIITTDNLATVTTANYLGAEVVSTYAIVPTDIFDIVYSYSVATTAGTYGEFLPTFVNGIIMLSQAASSGITLPTIANHLAVFTNTTGQLGENAATAINGGNIQAGLSGTAGSLISFPPTASSGSMIVKAINDTGGFNSTLSNSNIGQATVYSLPDTTTATANVLAAGAALVSGNLIQASGTAGAVVDSGITAATVSSAVSSNSLITTVSVTMTAAQVNGAFAAPFLLLAAAAGKTYIVQNAYIYTNSTGHTPFAGGGVAIVQYTATVNGAGADALGATIPAAEITAAASQIYNLSGIASATVTTGVTNTGLYFSNATGAFTGGTGSTITIVLQVATLTATV